MSCSNECKTWIEDTRWRKKIGKSRGIWTTGRPTDVWANPIQRSESIAQIWVLKSIDLISDKINGRTVADGRKQYDFDSKSETSSLTLSLEGFTTSLLIDATALCWDRS